VLVNVSDEPAEWSSVFIQNHWLYTELENFKFGYHDKYNHVYPSRSRLDSHLIVIQQAEIPIIELSLSVHVFRWYSSGFMN
jgi:hypothetical protein